ncbi:MAG TPA: hypothetical protein VKS60_04450 [Stellaceae bacterium]|nr:hypothetical protein [Stellaceae bacterium]
MTRIRTVLWLALAVAGAGLTLGSAQAAPASAADVHAACSRLGLDPSEAPFADCVATLNRATTALSADEMVTPARRQCAAKGLNPTSPAFANCVLDLEETP